MFLAGAVGLAGLMSGCGTARSVQVRVPVPVECRVDEPARPVMPTEILRPGVDPDRFAASAMAEIELREGYEGELRAALEQCTAPLRPS